LNRRTHTTPATSLKDGSMRMACFSKKALSSLQLSRLVKIKICLIHLINIQINFLLPLLCKSLRSIFSACSA
jgi:hypothetical protein